MSPETKAALERARALVEPPKQPTDGRQLAPMVQGLNLRKQARTDVRVGAKQPRRAKPCRSS